MKISKTAGKAVMWSLNRQLSRCIDDYNEAHRVLREYFEASHEVRSAKDSAKNFDKALVASGDAHGRYVTLRSIEGDLLDTFWNSELEKRWDAETVKHDYTSNVRESAA
jgi:hypothetical protein